jgi:hypothetical protein
LLHGHMGRWACGWGMGERAARTASREGDRCQRSASGSLHWPGPRISVPKHHRERRASSDSAPHRPPIAPDVGVGGVPRYTQPRVFSDLDPIGGRWTDLRFSAS